MIKGTELSQGKLLRYCKKVLGYCQGSRLSLYDIVCRALEKDGKPCPAEVKPRRWAIQNEAHILSSVVGYIPRKKVKEKKVKKPKVYAPTFKVTKDVTGDDFLMTFEWRKVRMIALKKHGARCQCCGASPADGVRINVDHIKPRKTHPELALDVNNLQVLCGECNHGKGNWDNTDWRPEPARGDEGSLEYFNRLMADRA